MHTMELRNIGRSNQINLKTYLGCRRSPIAKQPILKCAANIGQDKVHLRYFKIYIEILIIQPLLHLRLIFVLHHQHTTSSADLG